MSDDVQRIPIIEEQARVSKRLADTERVTVRTHPEEEHVLVREQLMHERVEVVRVQVEREVTEMPPVRTEGDVTIVPIVEERLVVEKRLFVVEELHLHRRAELTELSIPTTLRRTRVEVNREALNQQEND